MQCKGCGYRLWNLPGRLCPECGLGFQPSQFTFTPNAVAFECPHCRQEYYGTDPVKGHLVPREFDCVKCGRHIDMDEMILRPAAGVEDKATEGTIVPWRQREVQGRYKAWRDTVIAALVRPHRLGSALGDEVHFWEAAKFGMTTNLIILMLGSGFVFAPIFLIGGVGWGGGQILFVSIYLVVVTVLCVAMLFVWGGVAHFVLRMTGGMAFGFSRTMETVMYSTGANALTAVPCLGIYVGWIWWAVSAICMMRNGLKVATWRAVLAGVLAQVVVVGGFFGGVGLIAFAFANSATVAAQAAASASASPMSAVEMQTLMDAIGAYRSAHGGQWPRHGAELLLEPGSSLSVFSFMSTSMTNTDQTSVVIGNYNGAEFLMLDPEEQATTVGIAADRIVEGAAAHRVGDYVFTYHGVPTSGADPGLWVMVQSAHPKGTSGGGGFPAVVGLADGTIQRVQAGSMQAAVNRQNALRGQYGLGPLPLPSLVTERGTAGWSGAEAEEAEAAENGEEVESDEGSGDGG